MKQITIFLVASLAFFPLKGNAFEIDTRPGFLKSVSKEYEIITLNRPLAKLHGKTISVIDVQKKMDLLIHERHPELAHSTAMRYQFYMTNWRDTLTDMIQNELVKMEAEEFKINIPDGDVREEMLSRFGPNLFTRLDELHLTYDEAKEIAKDEVIIRNMSWYRIWARVLQLVKPEQIKKEYDAHLKTNPPKDEWVYRTVTVRSNELALSEEVAKKAYEVLGSGISSDLIPMTISQISHEIPQGVTISSSDEFHLASSSLSPEYRRILERLPLGSISMPESQVSRSDGSFVKRIFCLIDHRMESPPPFEELSAKIRDQLMQKYASMQKHDYFARLRKRFGCEHLVVETLFDPSYEPFFLK